MHSALSLTYIRLYYFTHQGGCLYTYSAVSTGRLSLTTGRPNRRSSSPAPVLAREDPGCSRMIAGLFAVAFAFGGWPLSP